MRQQLLLGTAQWGLNYGATNKIGRISDEGLTRVVEQARKLGIETLDTSPRYGDAETRIAEFAHDFHIQTKVLAAGLSESQIRDGLETSKRNLGRNHIWSILVHDWPELNAQERLRVKCILKELRESAEIDRFGVSIYDHSDLDVELNEISELDVVQIPTSIVDQRMRESAVVARMRDAGIVIQARSVFLQGILLDMRAGGYRHPDLAKFDEEIEALSVGKLNACVSYIRGQDWIGEVLLGVTSAEELIEISQSFNSVPLRLEWGSFASTDEKLLDPRSW